MSIPLDPLGVNSEEFGEHQSLRWPHGAWCGQCYENRRMRAAHRGHLGYEQSAIRRRVFMPRFLKKPDDAAVTPLSSPQLDGDALARKLPAVVEWLSCREWEDGTPRETATLLILWEEGQWKCCLNDRAGGRTTWRSDLTLVGLLEGLEAALREDVAEWRSRPKGTRRRT